MPNAEAIQDVNLNANLLSLRAVMIAMATVQLATATLGTLVAVYFAEIGSSQEIVSLATAAYSLGFMVGCFVVAGSIANIGHIRAYSASAAICSISALLFFLSENVAVLVVSRFAVGLATASLFAIGDAWISEKAEPELRGRVLSVYAILMGLMSVGSQLLLIFGPEDLDRLFVLLSVVYSISVIVIDTTRTSPPDSKSKANVRPRALLKEAPTAFWGALAIGMVSAAVLNVAPFGASVQGVSTEDIALMIAAIYLGRVIFQFPLGKASDRMDRRIVIFGMALVATIVFLGFALLDDPTTEAPDIEAGSLEHIAFLGALAMLGGSLLTMYSVLVAHASDRAVPVYVASSAVTMLFVWTSGSVVGPIAISVLSAFFGDQALVWTITAIMASLTLFVGHQLRAVEPPASAERTTHQDVVTTSVDVAPTEKAK